MINRGGLLQPVREEAAVFELGFSERRAEIGPFEVRVTQPGLFGPHTLLRLGLPGDERVVPGLNLCSGRVIIGFGALEEISEPSSRR